MDNEDKFYIEKEEKIKSLLDIEFLEKLKEIGKLYGWSGDYCVIGDFVMELHRLHNIELNQSDIEPYEYDGE